MTQIFYGQTQLVETSYRVFDGQGKPASLNQIIEALQASDAVFLGEQHDDPTAHALHFEIFRQAFDRYGKSRPVVLSLEMFERDVQLVVDEYLQDLISEANFIAASRAWNNYKTDYRPLVEFAKQNKLPVIAANAPRRYVNLVSRKGREALNQLSAEAKNSLAPLPFAPASKEYSEKFSALMGAGGMTTHGATLLESQSLWDATMADSVAKILQSKKNALAIHLNGGFHTENRLGTVEHLLKYNPKARVLVVTIKSVENFPNFD
ncbi:MAG TPA: ChaN family lipoprotein, partial [Pyrinomonadaceae bacterium]|nr:ChaN family lipoprotein [Pyrinomonadaceae bacterium]